MGPAATCLDERYECRTINDVLRRDNLIKSKLTKLAIQTSYLKWERVQKNILYLKWKRVQMIRLKNKWTTNGFYTWSIRLLSNRNHVLNLIHLKSE
jgi:hypothetical protein